MMGGVVLPTGTRLGIACLLLAPLLGVASCTSTGGGTSLVPSYKIIRSGGQSFQVLDNGRRGIVSVAPTVGRAFAAGRAAARTQRAGGDVTAPYRRAARAYLASTKPSCRLGPTLATSASQFSARYRCR